MGVFMGGGGGALFVASVLMTRSVTRCWYCQPPLLYSRLHHLPVGFDGGFRSEALMTPLLPTEEVQSAVAIMYKLSFNT